MGLKASKNHKSDPCQNRQCFAEAGKHFFSFKVFSLVLLSYLEMVDKMWQGVIDSLDVVGCNYLLRVKPQLQAIVREV